MFPITAIQLNELLHYFVFLIYYLVIFYLTNHSFLIFDILAQNNFNELKYFSQITEFIYFISIHSMWSNINRQFSILQFNYHINQIFIANNLSHMFDIFIRFDNLIQLFKFLWRLNQLICLCNWSNCFSIVFYVYLIKK